MKINVHSMLDRLLAIGSIVLLLVGGFVVWQLQDTNDSYDTPDETLQTTQPMQPQSQRSNTAFASLQPAGNFVGSGTAERWEQEGLYRLEIIASLEQPPEGTSYVGWLVGPSVVSVGALVDEGGGEWSNTFKSGESLFNYNTIIITLESSLGDFDAKSALHVLEGAF